ncbi:hypothetical protein BU23DRAFT_569869 [Bimuria novae-zelandiae CBS 107.79]|uniref:BTB domain-containing protein n=1 Tax=Bimuria novae-zelandiae CBS 107.79 TaxID=1447943 RepID=A0A6A5V2W1_9PLEO|nr:hypothetical protein BU23DRAFT_569869 [Bimuria novae-zelandiae CBS 107.79]
MAPTFKDFIQSPQFTFFVGNEGKPIVVHAAAIAATSEQLDALINGGMEESEKRCARLEDVQVDDFIWFCEYAYRGDYTDRDDNEWGGVFDATSKKKKGKKGRVASRNWDWAEPPAAPEPAPEPESSAEAYEELDT